MRNLLRVMTVSLLLTTLPLAANAAVFVSVSIAPPVLPAYVPPPMPAPDYIWAPGYWAWTDGGYYWVPGTWVLAPAPGLLWTPGYWGWVDGAYLWHAGYWGPHVGFYGGIDYGFGYGGFGYRGGYWRGSEFIVDRTVIERGPVNRVSFNGGAGGIVAHPRGEELRAGQERHTEMSAMQREHQLAASRDMTMRASLNRGRPPVAATQKAGMFYGHGVVAARTELPHPMSAQPHEQRLEGSAPRPAPRAYEGAPRAPEPQHAYQAAPRGPSAAGHGFEGAPHPAPAYAPRPAQSHGAEQTHGAERAQHGAERPGDHGRPG
jgi:hypothetical protein